MQVSLSRATPVDIQLIANSIQNTTTLVSPIIQALELEGFHHFSPPCSKTNKDVNCTIGSPWTEEFSQKILGDAQNSLDVADTFFPPEHLPQVHNSCSNPSSCILNVTTASEIIYSLEDGLDNGLEPVAGEEIRTKMVSRQSLLFAATGKKYDFNQTDGDSLCAVINKASIKWALNAAPLATVQRYIRSGVQLTTGTDIGPLSAGPLWLYNPLVSS